MITPRSSVPVIAILALGCSNRALQEVRELTERLNHENGKTDVAPEAIELVLIDVQHEFVEIEPVRPMLVLTMTTAPRAHIVDRHRLSMMSAAAARFCRTYPGHYEEMPPTNLAELIARNLEEFAADDPVDLKREREPWREGMHSKRTLRSHVGNVRSGKKAAARSHYCHQA